MFNTYCHLVPTTIFCKMIKSMFRFISVEGQDDIGVWAIHIYTVVPSMHMHVTYKARTSLLCPLCNCEPNLRNRLSTVGLQRIWEICWICFWGICWCPLPECNKSAHINTQRYWGHAIQCTCCFEGISEIYALCISALLMTSMEKLMYICTKMWCCFNLTMLPLFEVVALRGMKTF